MKLENARRNEYNLGILEGIGTNSVENLTVEKRNNLEDLERENEDVMAITSARQLPSECGEESIGTLKGINEKILNEIKAEKEEMIQQRENLTQEILSLDQKLSHLQLENQNLTVITKEQEKEISELNNEIQRHITEKENINNKYIELSNLNISLQKEIGNKTKEIEEKTSQFVLKEEKFKAEVNVLNNKLELYKKKHEDRDNSKNLTVQGYHVKNKNSKSSIKSKSDLKQAETKNKSPSPRNISIGSFVSVSPEQKELENLKILVAQNEEKIHHLNEKISFLEKENINYAQLIKENLDKYNHEIKQRNEDIEFMKRAYDDQRNKAVREYDMISSSLYELALQFMTVKSELAKVHSGKAGDMSFVDNLQL